VKPWCWVLVAAALALGPVRAADKPKPDAPAKPPAEQMKVLMKEVDDAMAAFRKEADKYKEGDPEEKLDKLWEAYVKKADANVPRVVDLACKEPKSATAFEALEWVVTTPRNIFQPYGKQAIALLRDHHATNPKIGKSCGFLGYYGESQNEPTLALLRAVSEKNPDRTARGHAFLGLARLTRNKARGMEYRKQGDPKPLFKEADRLFQLVSDEYDDCPELRRGKGTLGEQAEAELFELRSLAIGMTAPDIEGEDIDGKKFKLSDYRGKVVVLDFWGHW
jgi:hypothetical protein